MVDEALSACVIAYLGRPHESSAEERVRSQLGEAGVRLLPAARSVVTDLDRAEPAPWRLGAITEVAAAAHRFLRETHPELTEAAVRAIVNAYCFAWK